MSNLQGPNMSAASDTLKSVQSTEQSIRTLVFYNFPGKIFQVRVNGGVTFRTCAALGSQAILLITLYKLIKLYSKRYRIQGGGD